MDAYPLNLILAVATASATIFLGFLPTKSISSAFFARESGKAIFAWILVALSSPSQIAHYPLLYAFLSFAAWWQFRRDNLLNGKMWLSIAAGLGISVGIMLILAVTPAAYPHGLSLTADTLLLASIYLGGGILGLAYVCLVLIDSDGSHQPLIQRLVKLLAVLTLARAAVLLADILTVKPKDFTAVTSGSNTQSAYGVSISIPNISLVSLMPVFVLIILAFIAQRQTHFSSKRQPTRTLAAFIVVGIFSEIFIRSLVL